MLLPNSRALKSIDRLVDGAFSIVFGGSFDNLSYINLQCPDEVCAAPSIFGYL